MTQDEILASQATVVEVFRSLRDELRAATGNVEFSRKCDASPVTEWDVTVENRLRTALLSAYPDLGFQGEETGTHGSKKKYWLTDPIDGTSSFIRGLHYSTNMSALVIDDEVVAAVIYDFVLDHVYTAVKGHGAFKDGVQIHVNTKRRAKNLILYSFTRGKRFGLIREALDALGMRTLLTMGAAGHTYALIAEGKIDGAIALGTGLGMYDNAPGVLLAEEAGAVMLQYDEKKGVHRHEFIIGSPYVVERIEHSGLI